MVFRHWLIGRFRPLTINSEFALRSYNLGDDIDLTVQLETKRDLQLREGRVDLECEERYAETYMRMHETRHSPGFITTRGRPQIEAPAPKREVLQFSNLFVHSSVVFLENTDIHSKSLNTFKFRLDIQREWPPHANAGTVTWFIVTKVRDVSGREFINKREIEITL